STILSSKKLTGDGAAMKRRCTSCDTPVKICTRPSLNSTSSVCERGSKPTARILLELMRLRSICTSRWASLREREYRGAGGQCRGGHRHGAAHEQCAPADREYIGQLG